MSSEQVTDSEQTTDPWSVAERPHRARSLLDAVVPVAEDLGERLIAMRREIHSHPEPSWQEVETTERIAGWLREAGLEPVLLPETTGLYVDVGPERAEFAAAFRGDIDALPLTELTELPYASQNPGVAHSCGHDIHTTVMVGLALSLQRLHRESIEAGDDAGLGARFRIIFQPAEETMPGGAQEVVRQKVLRPVPRVFALHCDPRLDVGSIGTRIGAITSAADVVRIEVTGRGGHTSRPHLTEDVVGALAHIATTVPAVIARRIDARSAVSLVWGQIQAGSAHNAIPSIGTLVGTMRILDAEVWRDAGELLAQIISQCAAPFGIDVALEHIRGVPPVINAERETMLLENAGRQILGEQAVELAPQSMGGEDFAWMTQEVPGSMFRLGTRTPGGEDYDLHRGDYAPDERAIGVGTKVMLSAALRTLLDREGGRVQGGGPEGPGAEQVSFSATSSESSSLGS